VNTQSRLGRLRVSLSLDSGDEAVEGADRIREACDRTVQEARSCGIGPLAARRRGTVWYTRRRGGSRAAPSPVPVPLGGPARRSLPALVDGRRRLELQRKARDFLQRVVQLPQSGCSVWHEILILRDRPPNSARSPRVFFPQAIAGRCRRTGGAASSDEGADADPRDPTEAEFVRVLVAISAQILRIATRRVPSDRCGRRGGCATVDAGVERTFDRNEMPPRAEDFAPGVKQRSPPKHPPPGALPAQMNRETSDWAVGDQIA